MNKSSFLKYYCSTSSRGDADKSSDHSLNGADDRGLAEEGEVEKEPNKEAGGGADMGVDDGQGGIHTCSVRITSVEARPPQPQQARTRQHQ